MKDEKKAQKRLFILHPSAFTLIQKRRPGAPRPGV
jgi:hypothetical protein